MVVRYFPERKNLADTTLDQLRLRVLSGTQLEALRSIEHLNEKDTRCVWQGWLTAGVMNEMVGQRSLEELAAYLGGQKARLLNLNDGTDLTG